MGRRHLSVSVADYEVSDEQRRGVVEFTWGTVALQMGPNPPAAQSRVELDCAGKAYLIADPAEPWEAPVT